MNRISTVTVDDGEDEVVVTADNKNRKVDTSSLHSSGSSSWRLGSFRVSSEGMRFLVTSMVFVTTIVFALVNLSIGNNTTVWTPILTFSLGIFFKAPKVEKSKKGTAPVVTTAAAGSRPTSPS